MLGAGVASATYILNTSDVFPRRQMAMNSTVRDPEEVVRAGVAGVAGNAGGVASLLGEADDSRSGCTPAQHRRQL